MAMTKMLGVLCAALLLAGNVYARHDTDRPVPPAGRIETRVAADQLHLEWTVAAGHYLLRSKLRFETPTPGITLGTPRIPRGETLRHPFFGKVRGLRGRITVRIPISSDAPRPTTLELLATRQRCAIDGDCAPATTRRLRVDLPAAPSSPAASAPTVPAPGGSPADSLAKLLGGASDLGAVEDGGFLDPDVAYVLSTEVGNGDTLVARWKIADGYYLYKDKFAFTPVKAGAVKLGTPRLPPADRKQDPYFGAVDVYHRQVEATIPVDRSTLSGRILKLDIRYQGCAEAGLCYPPITKTVAFKLDEQAAIESSPAPPSVATTIATPTTIAANGSKDAELPAQDRIARSLVSGNTWLVLLSFLGFGLLLTFTPCVLPMIPILSSVIVGQGAAVSTRRGFTLSLVYVLGMAMAYTAAGVIAGLFGANLQIAFQNPWVLGSFSAVFVLLALSMFGFYDLQLPLSWQNKLTGVSARLRGGAYLSVGLMGLLSALIVGPCVAAPLAGALIYIGRTGDALLGGMALFALSMGMGIPLLVIGASAGKLLPRVGAWMNAVKATFGVLLLAVAIYLLDRIVPAWLTMLMWAALLIVTAIYMGAVDALPGGAGGWRRLWKGVGLVMLVYGVLLMVGAAGGRRDIFQPLKGFGVAANAEVAPGLRFTRIKGLTGLNTAIAAAAAQGKPVMLDFYADWCVSCKEMERFTFADAGVRSALASTVVLQADVTANDAADQRLLKTYGLYGPPGILFFGPDGRERPRYRVVGFMNAEKFRAVVAKATAG